VASKAALRTQVFYNSWKQGGKGRTTSRWTPLRWTHRILRRTLSQPLRGPGLGLRLQGMTPNKVWSPSFGSITRRNPIFVHLPNQAIAVKLLAPHYASWKRESMNDLPNLGNSCLMFRSFEIPRLFDTLLIPPFVIDNICRKRRSI
jgi:hypothetical protein